MASPMDFQTQLLELQKRMGSIPRGTSSGGPHSKRAEDDEEPLTPSRRFVSDSPSRDVLARHQLRSKASDLSLSSQASSRAVGTPASPGRVDFLSDLSDGLLVESRRMAYENKHLKKQLELLKGERDKFENQAANLTLLNGRLSEKEEKSADRIWELETQVSDTKEKVGRAKVDIDKLKKAKGELESRLSEASTALDNLKAEKIQLEKDAGQRLLLVTQEVEELRQGNADLNDENDALQKQLLEAQEEAQALRDNPRVAADDDNQPSLFPDPSEQEISVLLEPEALELGAGAGNSPELHRQTLETNLDHARATISKLRQYIIKQRQVTTSLTAPPPLSALQSTPRGYRNSVGSVGSARKRLFKPAPGFTSSPSKSFKMSPISRKTQTRVIIENDPEDLEDPEDPEDPEDEPEDSAAGWDQFDDVQSSKSSETHEHSVVESLGEIPSLHNKPSVVSIQTQGSDMSATPAKFRRNVLSEELGGLDKALKLTSAPQTFGLIALPKGEDVADLGKYDLVRMAAGDFGVLSKQASDSETAYRLVADEGSVNAPSSSLAQKLKSRYSKQKDELEKAAEERDALERIRVGMKEELDAKTAELEKKLDELEDAKEELEEKNALVAKMGEFSWVQSKVEDAGMLAVKKEEYKALEEKVLESEHEMAAFEEEVAGKNAQLQAKVAELKQVREEVAAKLAASESLQAKVDEMKAQVQSYESEIATLQKQLVAAKKEALTVREEVQGRLDAKEQALKEANVRLDTPDVSFVTLKAADLGMDVVPVAQHKQLVADAQRAVIAEAQAEESEQRVTELQQEKDQLKKVHNALSRDHVMLRHDTESLRLRQEAIVSENQTLREAQTRLRAKYEDKGYIHNEAKRAGFVAGDVVEQEKRELREKIAGLESELGAAQKAAAESEKNISSQYVSSSEYATMKQKYVLLKQKLAQELELKAAASGAEMATVTVTKNLERKLQDREEEVAGVKRSLDDAKGQLSESNKALEQKAATLAETNRQVETLTGQLQSLHLEKEQLRQSQEAESAKLQTLSQQLESAGDEKAALSAEISRLEKPDLDWLKTKVAGFGLVAISEADHRSVTKKAIEKEKTVQQLNAAITQLNMEYSSARLELGEEKKKLRQAQDELGDAQAALSKAQAENVHTAEGLSEKAHRISELNREIDAKSHEVESLRNRVRELVNSETELKVELAKAKAVDNEEGLRKKCADLGLMTVDRKGYSEMMAGLGMFGSELKPIAESLERATTSADFENSVNGLKNAARAQAAAVSEYENPSIDYVKESAGRLGMKVLTMGEYLDMKGGKESSEEVSDHASTVSEEAIDQKAQKSALDERSHEVEKLQEEIQSKERELRAVREKVRGALEGAETNEQDADVGRLVAARKRLHEQKEVVYTLQAVLSEKRHLLKKARRHKRRISLDEINTVDVKLDEKKHELEQSLEQLEKRQKLLQTQKREIETRRPVNSRALSEVRDVLENVQAELSSKRSALSVLRAYIASNRKDAERASKNGNLDDEEDLDRLVGELKTELRAACVESEHREDEYAAAVAALDPQLNERQQQVAQLREELVRKAKAVEKLETKYREQKVQLAKGEEYVSKREYESLKERCERELKRLRAELTVAKAGSAGSEGTTLHRVGSTETSSLYLDASSNVTVPEDAPLESPPMAADTTIGTLGTMGTILSFSSNQGNVSLPQVQAYASGHDLTLMPTSQANRLLRHNVTSQELVEKAAEFHLALVPDEELAELKRRVPASADDLAQAAEASGLLCISADKFVATTVCRKADPANVVVVPTSYYMKLARSHEWYRVHREEIEAMQSGNSSAAASVDFGRDNKRLAAQQTLKKFTQDAPRDSPAFALTQLAQQGGSAGLALDAASLRTVNTVISTKREMVAAITQTIIGEYLFKYFRKMGRFISSVSESRHERYFWIHPYSLTLYWSAMNPSLGDPHENKIRALAIAHVQSVADNNPLPPGLFHKSIIVSSDDGHSVKITCPTRQRHNIWYNSIKFLIEQNSDGLLDDSQVVPEEDEASLEAEQEVERESAFRHQQPRASILTGGPANTAPKGPRNRPSSRSLSRVNTNSSSRTSMSNVFRTSTGTRSPTSSRGTRMGSVRRKLANFRRD